MAADQELVAAVRDGLAALADPQKATAMQAYMKSAMPFRGVQAPAARRVFGPAIAAHPLPDGPAWQDTVAELYDHAGFREERYGALAVACHRRYREHLTPDRLPFLGHLVRTGGWWDLVDDIAAHLVGPLLLHHHRAAAPTIRRWARDEDRWLRRTAVICQLGAKDRTDVALLAEAVEANLDDPDFFLRKGVGWALRQYARTDPSWVRAFVDAHADRISPLSRREALKHLGAA